MFHNLASSVTGKNDQRKKARKMKKLHLPHHHLASRLVVWLDEHECEVLILYWVAEQKKKCTGSVFEWHQIGSEIEKMSIISQFNLVDFPLPPFLFNYESFIYFSSCFLTSFSESCSIAVCAQIKRKQKKAKQKTNNMRDLLKDEKKNCNEKMESRYFSIKFRRKTFSA